MTKQHFDVLLDLTEPIHLVEDPSNSLNYHQSNYPKMTDLQEDTPEEEDSQEEESLEEVEDTPEEEAHWEQDPLEEVVGDPHQSKYHNHKQESW